MGDDRWFWLLASGFWLLASGFWLLSFLEVSGCGCGLGEASASVRAIEVRHVLPCRIARRAMRTLAIPERRQALRSGTQMRERRQETFIRSCKRGLLSGNRLLVLDLPLFDGFSTFPPPVFQQLCLPIAHVLRLVVNKCVFCKCLPQLGVRRSGTSSSFLQTKTNTKTKNIFFGFLFSVFSGFLGFLGFLNSGF
jgi:hypothetical protein